PCPPIPRGPRGLNEQVLDTHELTAQAIVEQDRTLLRRAFLTDPLTNSIADTEALMTDLMAAERKALPDYWFQQE
ncbi:MAG: glycoside hydrolase family 4, partial [Kiritimatiellae bacterium]|nr:glycoside hydrolase family 4 [Kiritimatiellia bacterium]